MDDLFNIASSSLIAQQLSDLFVGRAVRSPNFELLPTISQHRLFPSPCILYPSQKLSNLYVAERALALLVLLMKLELWYIDNVKKRVSKIVSFGTLKLLYRKV